MCSNSQDRAADGDSVSVNSNNDCLDEARDSGRVVGRGWSQMWTTVWGDEAEVRSGAIV